MRQQQLEGLVLATIDRARAGYPVEDDRIEFKRAWPDPAKARQLAGVANRANGNYVIYIVGADESGALFELGNVDVADWWARLSSKFDGVEPDLINHIIVPIEEGKSVTALQFGTERTPYVVNADKGGSPEREVPIRDGTRTRSATRAELLRMLLPQTSVPPTLLLSGEAFAWYYPKQDQRDAVCIISGTATVFLEHTAPSGVMLPLHDMTATIEAEGGRTFPLSIYLEHAKAGEVPTAFGVYVKHDGVIATGPGSFGLYFDGTLPPGEQHFLQGVKEWRIHLRFGVTGSHRGTQTGGQLSPRKHEVLRSEHQVKLGEWEFRGVGAGDDHIPLVAPIFRV